MKNDSYGTSSVAERARTEDKYSSSPSEMDKQDMMKKMEAAGTPGPAHKALDALVGNWKAEVKCWHDATGQPQLSQGKAKASWILNGRFLEERFEGEMMGKPFHGLSLMGYDNTKQTFNTVWMSDMQTSIFVSEGKGENGDKLITLEGRANCPATGRRAVHMKTVCRIISSDKHLFEMYDGNKKTMEITYTRE